MKRNAWNARSSTVAMFKQGLALKHVANCCGHVLNHESSMVKKNHDNIDDP